MVQPMPLPGLFLLTAVAVHGVDIDSHNAGGSGGLSIAGQYHWTGNAAMGVVITQAAPPAAPGGGDGTSFAARCSMFGARCPGKLAQTARFHIRKLQQQGTGAP